MGLGGYLTWTSVAREIATRIGVSNVKVLPVETYNGGVFRIIKSEIFKNNPYILQEITESVHCFPMVLNDPNVNYCKRDTPTQATHRYDKHMIHQYYEHYGIQSNKLKCELYFTKEEIENVNNILLSLPEDFVTIEPQSNDEYCVNKKYPTEKWQLVVNDLVEKGINVVQVGRKTEEHNLKNVIDLSGQTSFREAGLVIKKSNAFISTDGGLMHAANAVSTPSVIVYTGFIHPRLTCYPENTNMWIGSDHGPCGMKAFCQKCFDGANSHDHSEVTKEVLKLLEKIG